MEFISVLIYVCIFLYILDYRWKPKHGNILPHRLPIIGHTLLFWGKDVHHVLSEWATKCGDLYTIQIFHHNVVVLNGYEAIYEGLVTKGKDLGGRIKSFRLTYVLNGKDIAFRDISPNWKKTRNLVHHHLRQYGEGLLHIQEIVLDISKDLIAIIKEKSVKNTPIDASEDIYLTITNTISSLITGKKYKTDDPEFQKWLTMSRTGDMYIVSMNNGWELDLFPWLRHFGIKSFKEINNNFIKLSLEVFAKLKEEFNQQESVDAISTGMAHQLLKELNGQGGEHEFLDEDTVRCVIMDIMAAGILTSSISLCAFIQIIASFPEKQEKVYDEIMKITDKYGCERITLINREEMPYTIALLLELQRYVSVAPLAAHLTMTDTNIQGCDIAKDKIVIQNFWHLHHDPKYWDNPWDFEPQRFLDENNELLPSDHINRKRVMAFGAGVRICLGEKLAMARLFIFVTTLMQEFKIQRMDCHKDENLHDPRNFDYNTLLKPKNRPVYFINRN